MVVCSDKQTYVTSDEDIGCGEKEDMEGRKRSDVGWEHRKKGRIWLQFTKPMIFLSIRPIYLNEALHHLYVLFTWVTVHSWIIESEDSHLL